MFLRSIITALKAPQKRAMFGVMRDGKSVLRIYFLHAALQSGLARSLQRPRTEKGLVRELAVKRPEFLSALLDLGCALGEIGEKRGQFYAKGRMLRLLGKEEGTDLAAFPEAFSTYYNSVYRRLPERMAGAEPGDYLPVIGNLVARFSRMIEPYVINLLEQAVPVLGPSSVLDVGCGSGGYLKQAAAINSKCTGIGLESDPSVADQARMNLERWGIADRFGIIQGDIRNPPKEFSHAFDAILCINNIYYFSPEERGPLYKGLIDMLRQGGALMIACSFQGHGRDVFSANLSAATVSMRGCWPLPDLEETRKLLLEAGFGKVRTARLMPGSSFYGMIARQGDPYNRYPRKG